MASNFPFHNIFLCEYWSSLLLSNLTIFIVIRALRQSEVLLWFLLVWGLNQQVHSINRMSSNFLDSWILLYAPWPPFQFMHIYLNMVINLYNINIEI
jgi:hypothetical protein